MKRILFFVAAILLAVGAISARTHNHNQSVAQARLIVAADTAGQPTTQLLATLKKYVSSHTGSSVILNLGGSYTRAQEVAAAAAKAQEGTGQLYAEAQANCAGKADSITQAHCVQAYVSSRITAVATPVAVAPPNPNDYIIRNNAPAVADDLATTLWALALLALAGGLIMTIKKPRYS